MLSYKQGNSCLGFFNTQTIGKFSSIMYLVPSVFKTMFPAPNKGTERPF